MRARQPEGAPARHHRGIQYTRPVPGAFSSAAASDRYSSQPCRKSRRSGSGDTARVAVALFDLPQAVILPGQHMVRVGFQRALVPDLREPVVAELAIGIADQIGDVGMVVMAERLELPDGRGIIVAVVDRRIGRAVAAGKPGSSTLDCLLGFFLGFWVVRPAGAGLVSGGGGAADGGSPPRRRRPAPVRAEDAANGAARNIVSITSLIADRVMRASSVSVWTIPPAANVNTGLPILTFP